MPAKSRINPWFNPVRVAAGNESKPNSRGVGVPNKQKRPGTSQARSERVAAVLKPVFEKNPSKTQLFLQNTRGAA